MCFYLETDSVVTIEIYYPSVVPKDRKTPGLFQLLSDLHHSAFQQVVDNKLP